MRIGPLHGVSLLAAEVLLTERHEIHARTLGQKCS